MSPPTSSRSNGILESIPRRAPLLGDSRTTIGTAEAARAKGLSALARSVQSQHKLFRSSLRFTVFSSLAVILSMCAAIGFGSMKVLAGTLSVGSLVAFYSFFIQLFEPLNGVAELYTRAHKTFASIRQLQSAFVLTPTIANAAMHRSAFAPCTD